MHKNWMYKFISIHIYFINIAIHNRFFGDSKCFVTGLLYFKVIKFVEFIFDMKKVLLKIKHFCKWCLCFRMKKKCEESFKEPTFFLNKILLLTNIKVYQLWISAFISLLPILLNLYYQQFYLCAFRNK